jgi:DNA-damage-inducible protein J
MSTKSEFIRARIEPDLKHNVEKILKKLGLTQTDAINIFYRQVLMYEGLPFEVKIPNKQTKKAIEDIQKGKNLNHAKTVDDLFDQLED